VLLIPNWLLCPRRNWRSLLNKCLQREARVRLVLLVEVDLVAVPKVIPRVDLVLELLLRVELAPKEQARREAK
jgi:hypothetical protein